MLLDLNVWELKQWKEIAFDLRDWFWLGTSSDPDTLHYNLGPRASFCFVLFRVWRDFNVHVIFDFYRNEIFMSFFPVPKGVIRVINEWPCSSETADISPYFSIRLTNWHTSEPYFISIRHHSFTSNPLRLFNYCRRVTWWENKKKIRKCNLWSKIMICSNRGKNKESDF